MAKEGLPRTLEEGNAADLGLLARTGMLGNALAGGASPSSPASVADITIPGFDASQQAGLNNMSYGMMNNIMARIMNPSLSGTNPLFTANSYTRPVLTSAQYQAPQAQPNAAPPTTQPALNNAMLQATLAQAQAQTQKTAQQKAANSGLGTLSDTDLRLLQILSGGGV